MDTGVLKDDTRIGWCGVVWVPAQSPSQVELDSLEGEFPIWDFHVGSRTARRVQLQGCSFTAIQVLA